LTLTKDKNQDQQRVKKNVEIWKYHMQPTTINTSCYIYPEGSSFWSTSQSPACRSL